jgi:hypothetical protein
VRSGSVGTAAHGRPHTGKADVSRGVAGNAFTGIAAAAASCPAGTHSVVRKRPIDSSDRRRSPRLMQTDNIFAFDTSIEFQHLDVNKIIIP